jgi:hypothetical protein
MSIQLCFLATVSSKCVLVVQNLLLLLSQLRNKCRIIFPVCSNVVIRNVTILAPHDSPNTDGIDPGTDIYSLPVKIQMHECTLFSILKLELWSKICRFQQQHLH